jgi:hypothetical protein
VRVLLADLDVARAALAEAERIQRVQTAQIDRVRAVSGTYADAVRGLSQHGSERDAVRARHYRQLLRDIDTALSGTADTDGQI